MFPKKLCNTCTFFCQKYVPGQTSKQPSTAPSLHVRHHTISTATTRNSSSLSRNTHTTIGSSLVAHSRPSEQSSSSTSSSPTPNSNQTYEVIGFDSGKEEHEDDWLEPPPPAEVSVMYYISSFNHIYYS